MLYPVSLNLKGRKVVIVGGGEVAARKAEALLAVGADVHVVSPHFCQAFEALGGIRRLQRGYDPSVLDGAGLVFAATNDEAINRRILTDGRRLGIWCNVVDGRDPGDFQLPATVRAGPLTVAVSTNGASPAFATRYARELREKTPKDLPEFLDALAEIRQEVLSRIPSRDARAAIFKQLAAPQSQTRFLTHGPTPWRHWAHHLIRRPARTSHP